MEGSGGGFSGGVVVVAEGFFAHGAGAAAVAVGEEVAALVGLLVGCDFWLDFGVHVLVPPTGDWCKVRD
jgi:hypothetical protein